MKPIAAVTLSFLLAGLAPAVAASLPEGLGTVDKLSARDVLEKMVKALGGEKAIRKHTARTVKGKLDIDGMIEGQLTMIAAAPNLSVSIADFEGYESVRSGYDGKVGWRIHPQLGATLLEGHLLSDMKAQADFYHSLNYAKFYKSIEMVGAVKFAEKDCFELKMVAECGAARSLFIDKETFLPRGVRMARDLPSVGEVEVTLVSEGFKKFDGVMVATRLRQTVGDIQELTTTITDVSFEPVKKSVFELPKRIRELLDDK